MRIDTHRRATQAIAIVLLSTVLTGCFPNENNPDNGSITFTNDSSRAVVVLSAFRNDLEAALNSDTTSPRDLPPEATLRVGYSFSPDPNDAEYCARKTRIIWILATDLEGSSNASDYQILDQLGPNLCFDERDAQYAYGDN